MAGSPLMHEIEAKGTCYRLGKKDDICITKIRAHRKHMMHHETAKCLSKNVLNYGLEKLISKMKGAGTQICVILEDDLHHGS